MPQIVPPKILDAALLQPYMCLLPDYQDDLGIQRYPIAEPGFSRMFFMARTALNFVVASNCVVS